jgi:hypothetical protein
MEETFQPHVLFVDHVSLYPITFKYFYFLFLFYSNFLQILENIFEYIGSDEIHQLLNLRLLLMLPMELLRHKNTSKEIPFIIRRTKVQCGKIEGISF